MHMWRNHLQAPAYLYHMAYLWDTHLSLLELAHTPTLQTVDTEVYIMSYVAGQNAKPLTKQILNC